MKYGIGQALLVLRPGAEWNVTNDVYTGIEWLDKTQTKPTLEEVSTTLAVLNDEEPMRLLRIERDKRLTDSDWVVTKAIETGDMVSNVWKAYRQSLRDLPLSSSPKLDSYYNLDLNSVNWPTKPL
tara:strand:+ start:554 stop:928 length:375 start_codon:yes stop_codon:yes gene_type:complete